MKIKYGCGWLLLSVLGTLFLPLAVHADENPLKWVEIDKPGPRGNIIVSPSEVSDMAVGRGSTIYALDSVNSKVYQTLNSGGTWENITSRLAAAGAGLPFRKIAIAPDTTGTVTVVTDNGTEVYLSTDGGTTWMGTNVPGLAGTTIQAITISRQYTEGGESLREIAIGTAEWGDSGNATTGQVWVFQLGKFVSSWQNQGLTVEPGHPGGEVSAMAYSPNYQRDNTIVVVASTGNDVAPSYCNQTRLCLGKRDTASGTTMWNVPTDYPVEIAPAGDTSGVRLNSSLALPSNYSGSDEDLRSLFVSYDREPNAGDDVYRIDDTTTYRLNTNGGTDINISSLAYYGTMSSGNLLAGDAGPITGSKIVRVRRTANPFGSSPAWYLSSAPPSGPGNAKVFWSQDGKQAYCGTGQSPGAALDESAFSMSSDGGDNWQQLSLIDTSIKLSDIAPAPDSNTLFVATYSSFGPEGIWRSTTTQMGLGYYWSRQLTMDTSSNRTILRLSPDYASDYTIYVAEEDGVLMAVSHTRGNSWKRRMAPGAVIDIAVVSENTVYAALPGGCIRKSTNGAAIWGEPVYTGLPDINMLAIAGGGTILVGGRNGDAAYSTDGGASFNRINEVIDSGDVQIVADANYQENGIIYAATNDPDQGIWRWTIGLSTRWEQIDTSITTLNTGQCIGGLAMGSEGTLYALRLEPVGSTSGGMTRSLNPAAPDKAEIEFNFINEALLAGTAFDSRAVFPNTLPYLKLSGDSGQNELWTLDTHDINNEIIYRFQDTLAASAPILILPSDRFQNKMNEPAGRALDIAFTWNKPSKNVTDYEIGIYPDATGANPVQLCSVSNSSDTPLVVMGPYQSSASKQFVEYNAGTAYYWRVRSIGPVKSPWSEMRSFTVEPVPAPVIQLLSPANGDASVSNTPSFSWAPVAGAAEYRFILADNVSLATPVVDAKTDGTGYALNEELEFGETYFWAVKAAAPVESAWSTIASFTVKEEPVEPPPPVVVKEIPPPVINLPVPPPPTEMVTEPPPTPPVPVTPAYIWAIIIAGVILVIVLVVLIVRIRRPA